MNISYNWLRELVETTLAPQELGVRLTMVGLAVEGVEAAGDDFIMEFDLTSNRPDCLSHLGVAREVAVIEDGRVRLPDAQPATVEGSAGSFTAVEILEPDLCPRYAARIVRGVRIGPSPAWLADRLQAIGQRPINNVADITNYVLHELGQPLHAFDLATLAEQRIVVRRAHAGEKLRTLDGVERTLDAEMLVIADATRAVALAGVMGGEATEVAGATRDVLIESAYFNPASVRRTARVLSLHTEASHRFERGVDYEGTLLAQARCVALICEIAGGTATADAIDIYPVRLEPAITDFRFQRVKDLTGFRVDPERILHILSLLGFAPHHPAILQETNPARRRQLIEEIIDAEKQSAKTGGHSEAATFIAPTWRTDIEREEDLVEEIARHHGYENIIEEIPASGVPGSYLANETRRRAARQTLVASGFDEAVCFSFIDAAHDAQFGLVPEFEKDLRHTPADADAGEPENFVGLVNPVLDGVTRMRPTLLPGLLDSIRRNFNHGTRNVRLFEMGHIFKSNTTEGELPDEREAFALALTGAATKAGRSGATRELDFYDLKGALEAVVDAMNIPALRFEPTSVQHLREGQAARVFLDEMAVGTLGQLGESSAAAYKFRQSVFVLEVDFTALLSVVETPVRYTPLPRYPSVVRDVSLLVDRRVTFDELRRAALALGEEEHRGASLVDVYEGANLPEGKRSITLRFEYRAGDRTLRDEEADAMHARIVDALEARSGAQLRG